MQTYSRLLIACALSGAAAVSAPALAATIGTGTVSVPSLYVPAINLASSPATYSAVFGSTFETLGTGSFTNVTGLTGVENGTLSFSSMVDTTINQTVTNFFMFADSMGGNYSFSADSVTTKAYNVTPGVTSSISLYLLGNTSDVARGFTATPTSLTLSLNSTGASAFSSAATLAIPPAVPEPASWAMMIVGLGLAGAALRRRQRPARFGGYNVA